MGCGSDVVDMRDRERELERERERESERERKKEIGWQSEVGNMLW